MFDPFCGCGTTDHAAEKLGQQWIGNDATHFAIGLIWFKPDGKRTEKAIVEVKGGGMGVKDIGRLAQVMERERAPFGVLLTAQLPTRAMERDAAAVGVWTNEYTGRTHPRLQIITLAELFGGKRPDIPWVDTSAQKKARREERGQERLF